MIFRNIMYSNFGGFSNEIINYKLTPLIKLLKRKYFLQSLEQALIFLRVKHFKMALTKSAEK